MVEPSGFCLPDFTLLHLDSKDPRKVRPKGDVIPLRKAGNVLIIDLWARQDATSEKLGRTVKVWLESAKWLNLIFEEWKMPKRQAKSDHMQTKNQTWIARVMVGRTASHTLGGRVGAPCGVLHAVQGLVQTLCCSSTSEAFRAR